MAIELEMLQLNTTVSQYFFEGLLNDCWNGKIRSFLTVKKFTLSAQTSSALIHTTKCQAALIEDNLRDGYKYVLTPWFQNDPLEKRYGQYRQISGGKVLVAVKDVIRSENILKIKILVRERFNIDPSLKEDGKYEEVTAKAARRHWIHSS